MDTTLVINELRAQFLRVCPEKEQMRRIIAPYGNQDERTGVLFEAINGSGVLDLLESPPIASGPFLEPFPSAGSVGAIRTRSHSGPRTRNRMRAAVVQGNTAFADLPTSAFGAETTQTSKSKDEPHKDAVKDKHRSSKPAKSVPIHSSMNDEDDIIHFEDDSMDSSIQESLKTKPKKHVLPFSRIFHRKNSHFNGNQRGNDNSKKELSKNSDTKLSAERNKSKMDLQLIPSHHHQRRRSKFSMNFDYDEKFDEDEDEDEDEDGDINLQSQFFQIKEERLKSNRFLEPELAQSQNSTNLYIMSNAANNGTSINHQAPNNHNANSSQIRNKNSNMSSSFRARSNSDGEMQRDNLNSVTNSIITDSKKGQDIKSDKNPIGKKHNAVSRGRDNETRSFTDSNGLSDLDSYINEQDLDGLNLDSLPTESQIPRSYKEEEYDLHLPKNTRYRTESLDDSNVVSHQLENVISDSGVSSSLIDSEFSVDNFSESDSVSLNDNYDKTDKLEQSYNLPSHSIPLSLDEYGLFHGQDDSTINSAFDNAVFAFNSPRKVESRKDRSNSAVSVKEAILVRQSQRKGSISSNLTSKPLQRGHRRSSSATLEEYKKAHRPHDDKPISKVMPKVLPVIHPLALSNLETPNSRRNSRADVLQIEKKPIIPHVDNNSALSALFKKNKSSGNDLDVLKYFSFVSGNKVVEYESMPLDIYIQSSLKYARKPITTRVRKTAIIFEVIGYILLLYSTKFKPEDFEKDGLDISRLTNPNSFSLKIVDEGGEPFEDDFGKLDRLSIIQTLSDTEVVLCDVDDLERAKNEIKTPLPYEINDGSITYSVGKSEGYAKSNSSGNINQLSFYKPILMSSENLSEQTLAITVYLFPNLNPKFNYTTIKVNANAKFSDLLIKYCKSKRMNPSDYVMKIPNKPLIYDLNDTVLTLDGNNEVEIVSKKDARELRLDKARGDKTMTALPTIQSNDLTPLTLEVDNSYLKQKDNAPVNDNYGNEGNGKYKPKKSGTKHKLSLYKQNSSNSVVNNGGISVANASGIGSGFFKSKNSSKSSLPGNAVIGLGNLSQHHLGSTGDINSGNYPNQYQDLLTGAYHKYRVWRRQQMSFINKHERTLAIDGDYIYIVPPENHMHWHENIRTKSLHISQIVLVKKSKRVPEHFKFFVQRGADDIKRYYFEAISPEECTEIVTRLQTLLGAYRMNHKRI